MLFAEKSFFSLVCYFSAFSVCCRIDLELRFQRTECKDFNDMDFIPKTSHPYTFSLFKLELPQTCSPFFHLLFFMGIMVRKEIYSPFQIYVSKKNCEGDTLILAGAMLKVMCILNFCFYVNWWFRNEKCSYILLQISLPCSMEILMPVDY